MNYFVKPHPDMLGMACKQCGGVRRQLPVSVAIIIVRNLIKTIIMLGALKDQDEMYLLPGRVKLRS